MAAINRVVLVGNLTRDPELRHTPSGTAVTTLRVAVNDRVKRGEEWTDAAYYFDVTVWGRRKLAYEIDKKTDGVYHLLSFSTDGETLDEISRVLKIDDNVMRHLATRRYRPGSTQPVAVGGPGREDVVEPIYTSLEEE